MGEVRRTVTMQNAIRALIAIGVLPLCWGQGPSAFAVTGAADYRSGTFGIPRGSIFSIFGENLAAAQALAASLPLATALGGVSVAVYDGDGPGASLIGQCPLLYVSPRQINAILPSSVPAGLVYLTVVSGALQLPRQAVLATGGRFAAFTQRAIGFGPAIVQQFDGGGLSINSLSSPATPGSTLVLWGTGLGPVDSDVTAPVAKNLAADISISIGGVKVIPEYAGRAPGSPGVDQINFEIPSSAAKGCFVPLHVNVGERAGNRTTVAIGSASECANEIGLSTAELYLLDGGGTVRVSVLDFQTTTQLQDGAITQSAKAWEADYNTASLSRLLDSRMYGTSCSTDEQLSAGTGSNPSRPLSPEITGASGCSWTFTDNGSVAESLGSQTCRGVQYRFVASATSVSVPLPLPRSNAGLMGLSAERDSSGAVTALWQLIPNAAQSLTVTIGSEFQSPNPFGIPQIHRASVSCETSAGQGNLQIPAAEANAALQYAQILPVVMSADDNARLVLGVKSDRVALVVVRMENSLVGQATLQSPRP